MPDPHRPQPPPRRLRDLVDAFPFGFAPFLIFALTLVSIGWMLSHPVPAKVADVTLWTFADIHHRAYQKALAAFYEKHPGKTVDLQLVHNVAVTSRLRAAFWADLDVPDLVEVEISSAGTFFRGKIDDLGFMDLTPWLKESGLYDRIVKTRFAPYTTRGKIFGLPHDVHPVMLAYRRDLFEELGIDPEKLATWDDFVREGRRVTLPGKRYMIQLSDSNGGTFEPMLFQRDGGYFDADGKLIMDNEIAIDTVKWYIPLVAGPKLIANDIGGRDIFARSVESGILLSFICPDWKSKSVETQVGNMAGKMALMPLPAFEPGGRRTSTQGGTMLGITKRCADKALAKALALHLYLDREDLVNRFRELNILPPVKDVWDSPVFDEPRPYWSNQPIGRMYVELASRVPPQYSSPFISLAKNKMSEVISACAIYYNEHGDEGFDAFVRTRLQETADYVRRQMKRNPF